MSKTITNSLQGLYEASSELTLLLGESTIIDKYIVNVEYLAKGSYTKSFISLEDVMVKETGDEYPRLRADLRMDEFKFFNTQLTNFINRTLVGTLALTSVRGNEPVQEFMFIDDYSTDIDLVIAECKTNTALRDAMDLVNFTWLSKIDDDLITEELETMFVDNDNIIPFIFLDNISVIKLDKINIPDSPELEKGNLLSVPDHNATFPNSPIDENIKHPTVVFVNDETYLLTLSHAGYLCVRKTDMLEYWHKELTWTR